ncbi:30S ribosomal protein S9 [Pseudonocardia endophytica]|uniref:Small ribosomal subunit protein uS9 n=1 Tax=Pseudonocardia endophytica TaxID=401976 RepID=A0A4R1HSK5_PSEEN|nr:30S ribosomal protein S9 [Pseudonocardia endophytica]TCK20372.1 small subunit ribosomal protein S9 [Pseudonocardia endophytica]
MTSPEDGQDEVAYTAETEGVETEGVETEGVEAEATEGELTETIGEEVADVDYSIGDASDFDADAFAAEAPVLGDRPVQTVGRRKEAVVRIRMVPGSGNFTLNGKALDEYFPNKLHQQLVKDPLTTVEKTERFDIHANLHGGGTSGQAGALRLAIARALAELDSEDRPPLKKAGFLTRDDRAVERKKYGLKKARKAPQYSKR